MKHLYMREKKNVRFLETNFCSKNPTEIHKAVDIFKGILTISIKQKINQSNIHRWKKTEGPKQRDPGATLENAFPKLKNSKLESERLRRRSRDGFSSVVEENERAFQLMRKPKVSKVLPLFKNLPRRKNRIKICWCCLEFKTLICAKGMAFTLSSELGKTIVSN